MYCGPNTVRTIGAPLGPQCIFSYTTSYPVKTTSKQAHYAPLHPLEPFPRNAAQHKTLLLLDSRASNYLLLRTQKGNLYIADIYIYIYTCICNYISGISVEMAVQRIERGDLWKSKARVLQLRLRDRFRVAVDRHRRRPPMFSDGYFSSTLQRWLTRLRDFRRDSLQSSSAFYRKRGQPFLHTLHIRTYTNTLLYVYTYVNCSRAYLYLVFVVAVSTDFSAEEDSVILRMLQSVAVPLLGNMCHVFMHGLNRVQVCGIACD